jgi:hypothetical protein
MHIGKQLRYYLAYAIHGRKSGPERKPMQQAKRATPRKGPPRDEDYKAWIRTLPCVGCGKEGASQAAHTGDDGGMSMKASDYSCLPLCAWCHTLGSHCYHSASGKQYLEARVGRTCTAMVGELVRERRAMRGANLLARSGS